MKKYNSLIFILIIFSVINLNAQFTWEFMGRPNVADIRSMGITNDANIIYATQGSNAYYSLDKGLNWNLLTFMNSGGQISEIIATTLYVDENDKVFLGDFFSNILYHGSYNNIDFHSFGGFGSMVLGVGSAIFSATNGNVFASQVFTTQLGNAFSNAQYAGGTDMYFRSFAKNNAEQLYGVSDLWELPTTAELFTSTGDANWTKITTLPSGVAPKKVAINSFGHIFIATYSSGVFVSTDDAASWAFLGIDGLPSLNPQDLFIDKSDETIYLLLEDEGLYQMTSTGEWISLTDNILEDVIFSKVIVFNTNEIFLATRNKGFYYSDDAGQTWEIRNNGFSFDTGTNTIGITKEMAIRDNDIFIANGKVLLHSNNYGQSWDGNWVTYPNDAYIYDLMFSPSEMYIFMEEFPTPGNPSVGNIYSSSNNNLSWDFLSSGFGQRVKLFFDEATDELWAYGIISSNNGSMSIAHSTDGGMNWTTKYTPSFPAPLLSLGEIHCMKKIDNNTLAAIYYEQSAANPSMKSSWIVYSNDNGDTWDEVKISDENANVIARCKFEIATNGDLYFLDTHDDLKISIDKGLTWTTTAANSIPQGENFRINSNNEFFIAGENGVYWSDDFGITWQEIHDGLTDTDVIIFEIDNTNNQLYAFTDEGLFRTNSTTSAQQHHLEKNISIYPNPFLNNITVTSSKNQIDKKIEIYDVKGRTMATINLTSPQEKVCLNGLTSGFYFYKISQNGIIQQTGKLVKLENK